MQPPFDFDATSTLYQGARGHQEDAIIADFSRGAEMSFAVLADGMGGHSAGDVASKIVVTEVFSELMFQRNDPEGFERDATARLQTAARAANECIKAHAESDPGTKGMGATLVATVLLNEHLYWISIGDSPLFLFRDNKLLQLNEDHSMAPQIDFMIEAGLISEEEGANHPDRGVLTSVLFGEHIPKIDCPPCPVKLRDGDLLIVASDGLQFLSNSEIEKILTQYQHANSADIADQLLAELCALEDPDLDNVSFSLVKLVAVQPRSQAGSAGLRCVV